MAINNNQMSNLPQATRDRIEADARTSYPVVASHTQTDGPRTGYRKGALTEAERAECLTEFIEYVINFPPALSKSAMSEWVEEVRTWGRTALAKYRDVGVTPKIVIEYMPVHPEDARKPGCPAQFPMHLLNADQAFSNHGQTLQRLKERGGLGVAEILAVVNRKSWSYYGKLKWEEALKMLNEILNKEVGNG